jgi:O-antigen/teichoic acid export membrane protein
MQDGKNREEADVFGTSMWIALAIAAALVGVVVIVISYGWVHPETLLGITHANGDDIMAIFVACTLVALGVVTSVAEGARSGYLEQYITNGWNGVGACLSVLAMLVVAYWLPTLTGMCLAVFGTVALARMGNTLALIGRRPYLAPAPSHFRWHTALELVGSSAAFLVVQLNTLAVFEVPTLLVGWGVSAGAATPLNVLLRLEALLATGLLMVTVPLWPAIIDAQLKGEREWIERAARRLLIFTVLYSGTIGALIAFFGQALIRIWLGNGIEVTPSLQAWVGALFPLWMTIHALYTLLIGMRKIWWAAIAVSVWGVLICVGGLLLVPHWEAVGMAVALCAGATTCLPILCVMTWRVLKSA